MRAARLSFLPSFLPSLLPSVLRALGSARLPLRGLCGRPGTRGGRLRGRGGAGSSDGMAAGRGGAGGSERRGAVRRLAPSRGGRRCGSARSVAAAAAPCGAVSLPGRWPPANGAIPQLLSANRCVREEQRGLRHCRSTCNWSRLRPRCAGCMRRD